MAPVVLASGSPRRREILTALGVAFDVQPADIDEAVQPGEAPLDYVRRLAASKAGAVAAAQPGRVVVAADTTVVIDGEILGKPAGIDEARAMARRLAGRTHQVLTGIAVAAGGAVLVDVETTHVTFSVLSDDLIEWYVAQSEPYDKAGGYALQGAAAAFVERVDGNVANVIGLPVPLLLRLATEIGHPLVP
jgi:nucleoside triphosphate pyrophosphatase